MSLKDLEVLKLDKAVELLQNTAGWDSSGGKTPKKEAWEDMARLCGCLPVALRAAGSFLANTPDSSPEQYARELQDEKQRLKRIGKEGVEEDLDLKLSLSYRRLEPDAAMVFRELSVFPFDFDANAEETVCQDEGHSHLIELVRWSLVEYQRLEPESEGRYHQHDLVRLFAAGRLEEGSEIARNDARKRHAEHYKELLSEADALYLKGGLSIQSALALFDREEANILAGWAWMEKIYLKNQMVAGLCSDYPAAGIHILALRQHPKERLRWSKIGLEISRQRDNPRLEGVHLGILGRAYADLGEMRKAVEYLEKSLAIHRQNRDRETEGSTLGSLGQVYAALGESYKSIELGRQALAIHREMGDRRGEGNALGNLGGAYLKLGDTRQAIEYLKEALAIHREMGDRRGEANTLGNLGGAYSKLGDTRQAIEFIKEALAIHREMGGRRGEANTLGNLGGAYSKLGETRQAIEYLKEALAIHREMGDQRGEANTLGNLGGAYSKLGDTRQAIEFIQEALAIHREISDRRGEANTLGNLGGAYSKLGDTRQAIEYLKEALAIHREIGDRRGEASTLGNLGGAYSSRGDIHQAIEFSKEALAIHREIGDRRGESISLANLAGAYSKLGDVQLGIDYYERSLAINEEIGDLRGEAKNFDTLSGAYLNSGNRLKAIEFAEKALAIHREIGDLHGVVAALANLGRSYSCQGDPHKAIGFYEEALAINLKFGDIRAEAKLLSNIGGCHSSIGNFADAMDFYRKSLAIYSEMSDPRGEGNTLWKMSKALFNLGQREKAIHCAEAAQKIFLDIRSPISMTVGKKLREWNASNQEKKTDKDGLTENNAKKCKPCIVLDCLKQECDTALMSGSGLSKGNALAKLGQAYIDLGAIRKGIEYLKQSLEIYREIEDHEREGCAYFDISQVLDKIGQQGDAIENAKYALSIFERIESPHAETVRKKLSEWQGELE